VLCGPPRDGAVVEATEAGGGTITGAQGRPTLARGHGSEGAAPTGGGPAGAVALPI